MPHLPRFFRKYPLQLFLSFKYFGGGEPQLLRNCYIPGTVLDGGRWWWARDPRPPGDGRFSGHLHYCVMNALTTEALGIAEFTSGSSSHNPVCWDHLLEGVRSTETEKISKTCLGNSIGVWGWLGVKDIFQAKICSHTELVMPPSLIFTVLVSFIITSI